MSPTTITRSAATRAVVVLTTVGCAGPSSALDPAGRGADRIATLFWWMTGGALAVWLGVIVITIYATYFSPGGASRAAIRRVVIGGGLVVPGALLTVLLVFGLASIPPLLAAPPPGSLSIAVTGEQWWWRVRYVTKEGTFVDLANEIHLVAGEPAALRLDSPDVIHSLWIPALGGKMDMIPGRTTHLTLEPSRAGVYEGICAEYCGLSHTFMRFSVVVSDREEFERWLARQAEPAVPPTEPIAARGHELFLANGCGACHTVRGTPARGVVGPDLTHVGGRRTIGAGRLPNELGALHRWIARPSDAKPGVTMPAFGMLAADELHALAVYLRGLQ